MSFSQHMPGNEGQKDDVKDVRSWGSESGGLCECLRDCRYRLERWDNSDLGQDYSLFSHICGKGAGVPTGKAIFQVLQNIAIHYFLYSIMRQRLHLKGKEANDGIFMDLLDVRVRGPHFEDSPAKVSPVSPFVVSCYHGNYNPKSVHEFLEPFIKELKTLQICGFQYHDICYSVTIQNVICDAPARAFIKCIKGHGGFFGCEQCV